MQSSTIESAWGPVLPMRCVKGGELFRLDPRVTALRRAEEMVVDQLDREQLQTRLTEGRLTAHMCDYWLRRRPKEVPRINGMPLWLAVFSADVAA